MAQNKMEDLRNHLFAALERLNDEETNEKNIELEVSKSKSICNLASAIVETAKVEIEFLTAIGADSTKSSLFSEIDQPQQIT